MALPPSLATFGFIPAPRRVNTEVLDPSSNRKSLGVPPIHLLRNIATLLCVIGAIGIVIGGSMKGGFFYKSFYSEGVLHALKSPQFYAPIGGAIALSITAGICRHYAFRKIDASLLKKMEIKQAQSVKGQKVRAVFEMAGLGSLFAPGDIFVSCIRLGRSFRK